MPRIFELKCSEYNKNYNIQVSGVFLCLASNFLFKINPEGKLLSEERKSIFVHFVMRLLYASQRGQPDIRTAVSFLCSQLKTPDKDNYKKLARVMKYPQETPDLTLHLRGLEGGKIYWWVDASYATHEELEGHTGGTLSMGVGSVYSTSTKQKLVSRSLTKSKLIGVHDVLPQVLWTNHFLQAQGLPIDKAVIYQANTSTIQIEKNGRRSSGKHTKHMDIQ